MKKGMSHHVKNFFIENSIEIGVTLFVSFQISISVCFGFFCYYVFGLSDNWSAFSGWMFFGFSNMLWAMGMKISCHNCGSLLPFFKGALTTITRGGYIDYRETFSCKKCGYKTIVEYPCI